MNEKNLLNENQIHQMIFLGNKAGLTFKQVDQVIPNLSRTKLKSLWSKYPTNWSYNRRIVHKHHKADIIEMILLGVNILSISWIYKYHPQTVLRFVEQQSISQEWEVKLCRHCEKSFVSFDKKRCCNNSTCKHRDKKMYDQIRWKKKNI